LQSRLQLGIFAKFASLFTKLSKLQTPNTKPLDTPFGAFWQITQMQISNAKPLEMLAAKPDSSFDHMACLRITFLIDFSKTILEIRLLNLEFVVINTKNPKTDSPHLE